jgi:hypothetical protein
MRYRMTSRATRDVVSRNGQSARRRSRSTIFPGPPPRPNAGSGSALCLAIKDVSVGWRRRECVTAALLAGAGLGVVAVLEFLKRRWAARLKSQARPIVRRRPPARPTTALVRFVRQEP